MTVIVDVDGSTATVPALDVTAPTEPVVVGTDHVAGTFNETAPPASGVLPAVYVKTRFLPVEPTSTVLGSTVMVP